MKEKIYPDYIVRVDEPGHLEAVRCAVRNIRAIREIAPIETDSPLLLRMLFRERFHSPELYNGPTVPDDDECWMRVRDVLDVVRALKHVQSVEPVVREGEWDAGAGSYGISQEGCATVGELRRVLQSLPDHMPVLVEHYNEKDEITGKEYNSGDNKISLCQLTPIGDATDDEDAPLFLRLCANRYES